MRAVGHTRRLVLGYGHTLNLGKCRACGTFNPTIPGEGVAATCSGCGSELFRHEMVCKASTFTPPKKVADDTDVDLLGKRARQMRIKEIKRRAATVQGLDRDSGCTGHGQRRSRPVRTNP